MPEFDYEALNEDNAASSGKISAESVSAAVAQLEAQGLIITSIQHVIPTDDTTLSSSNSPKTLEFAINNEQQAIRQRIAEVLEEREILAPALAAFAEELPPGRSRRELSKLVTRLQSAATAEDFCGADDSRTASWLLLLGRHSDSQRLLSGLFEEAMRENESQTLWNRAFIYPSLVVLASLGVLIFLSVAVVPTFTSIFDDFDLDLPRMTIFVVDSSSIILRSPASFAMGIFFLISVFYLLSRLIRIWGLPGRIGNALTAGNSLQVTTMARFTHRLAESLDAGFELPAALRLAGGAEGRGGMRRTALQLAGEIEQKHLDLSNSPSARRLPTTVVHALQAGENKSPNVPLLRQLAELYSTRVRDRYNWATGFVAQFAMIGVGLAVGIVVLALFLPLVQLVNGLSG